MIEFKDVTKIYKAKKNKDVLAIDNISFKLPDKGLIFLLGKSGSGKSTLLNILGTLDSPTKGNIFINNKDITKFKAKELTSYRSNHIGFIFQEYNLLEDLNVYDNISLSLDLKHTKNNQDIINDSLKTVGLDGMGNRKINELSGGERQRIAIARAIVKNPSLILADEPTGNLDTLNSENVFNILKEISKNHLVVVVSHDRENAEKYADGIMEIEDGKIIHNSIKIKKETKEKELAINKSHISFLKRLKLAFSMIKNKKIMLVITIILLAVSFSMFGFSYSLQNFDLNRTHAESMKHENEKRLNIKKGDVRGDYQLYNILNNDDINYITNNLNSNYYKENYLYTDGFNSLAKIDLKEIKKEDLRESAYYSLYTDNLKIIEYASDKINELNIIGKVPENGNEVLIPEFLADYLINYKFVGFDDSNKSQDENLIDVNTYDELLGKKLGLEKTYLIISGIVKDDELAKYKELINESELKMRKKPTKLFEEFVSIYKDKINIVYTTKNVLDKSTFSEVRALNNDIYGQVIHYKGKEYFETSFLKMLNDEDKIEIWNGTKYETVSNLKDNELILDSNTLEFLAEGRILEKLKTVMKKEREKYDKKVKEREELIKKQEEEMMQNPDYIYVPVPEVEELDYDFLTRKVFLEEIKSMNIIGEKFDIEIIDKYKTYSQKESIIYSFVIKGVAFNNMYNYINSSLQNYLFPPVIPVSIQVEEENVEELNNIFNKFDNYEVVTRFSNTFDNIAKIVNKIEIVSKYVTIGFLTFSIILLTFFLINNLKSNKRKIGILRALGTKIIDIIKIFVLENAIIGFFAFVLAGIGSILICELVNNYITKELYFYARPIIFNMRSVISILIVIAIVILISLVIPIIKISKDKPIDLIQNK